MRWFISILLGGAVTVAASAVRAADVAQDRVEPDARKDEGREVELFWASAGGGLQFLDLRTFQADETLLSAGLVPTNDTGPVTSLGFGLRFVPLTLGVRGSVGFFEDTSVVRSVRRMRLYSLNGELTLRIVPGLTAEPYLLFGAGYTRLTGLEDVLDEVGEGFTVRGPNIRVGFGLDYFASDTISVGLLATADLLLLSPPGSSVRGLMKAERVETIGDAKARVLEGDGVSVGTAFGLMIAPAIHFD